MSTGKQPNSHARPLSVKGIASATAPAKSRDIILSHCCGSPNWDTTTAGHKQAAYLCQMLNRQIISLCSLWIQVANFSLKDISFCPIPFSNVCKKPNLLASLLGMFQEANLFENCISILGIFPQDSLF